LYKRGFEPHFALIPYVFISLLKNFGIISNLS
jgi:hypothetical protein